MSEPTEKPDELWERLVDALGFCCDCYSEAYCSCWDKNLLAFVRSEITRAADEAYRKALNILEHDPGNVGTWATCCRKNLQVLADEIRALQKRSER